MSVIMKLSNLRKFANLKYYNWNKNTRKESQIQENIRVYQNHFLKSIKSAWRTPKNFGYYF